MNENIDVYVNGQKIDLYRGMKVKHALIAYDQSLYKAALAGECASRTKTGLQLDSKAAWRMGPEYSLWQRRDENDQLHDSNFLKCLRIVVKCLRMIVLRPERAE